MTDTDKEQEALRREFEEEAKSRDIPVNQIMELSLFGKELGYTYESNVAAVSWELFQAGAAYARKAALEEAALKCFEIMRKGDQNSDSLYGLKEQRVAAACGDAIRDIYD